MLIVAALLGIYAFTRMRLKMLHKNNEVLKNAVDVAVSSLNETLKALQHSNAQKDKLFSILSHDMRSPINNLITVLQHTESDIMNRENISQALLEVKKDATTIQKTLDNLLNWSMLQMGKKQASKNALKMHSFLKSHIKLYNKLAQDKSIHVSTQCDADIVIEADRNQMAVIFRNFIDNAIKFTPHHGTIIIGVIKFPFYYTLYVANSGNPISQNAIDRILDSQEICTTLGTNNEKGTGLGLQLCKEFILSMNSRLEISVNNENRYTVFSFNLAREVQTE
jgi:signal transduction histidine kinase